MIISCHKYLSLFGSSNRMGICSLKCEGKIYEDEKELNEVMNRSFQLVFAKEERFERGELNERRTVMSQIEMEPGEIKQLIEGLDKRKATGPDEISGCIFQECKEQLADMILEIVQVLHKGRKGAYGLEKSYYRTNSQRRKKRRPVEL